MSLAVTYEQFATSTDCSTGSLGSTAQAWSNSGTDAICVLNNGDSKSYRSALSCVASKPTITTTECTGSTDCSANCNNVIYAVTYTAQQFKLTRQKDVCYSGSIKLEGQTASDFSAKVSFSGSMVTNYAKDPCSGASASAPVSTLTAVFATLVASLLW